MKSKPRYPGIAASSLNQQWRPRENQMETISATTPNAQQGPEVTVTVDQIQRTVHRGSHLVSELKSEFSIDPALVLDEVIDGQFKDLDDTARVVIKGGEVFFSHQRKGGSS